LGSIAIFFYVGVETIALGSVIDYAKTLGLAAAENYSWITPIAMSIGYIAGILFIPKYLSQNTALKICAIVAVIGTICVATLPAHLSIYSIGIVALGCSLMWPAIWPLAMKDLGKFTKTGSSLLTMGLFGGAILTLLFGWFKDLFGAQNAYWLCLPCFIYIAFYAFKGCKLR
jgi:glucose/galactose transporter